jgi:hypothetical protein
MPDRVDRRSVAYVDLEAVRGALEAAGATPVQFAGKLAAFAKGHGRLLSAYFYGDVDPEEAKELRRLGGEARATAEDGEGSAPESIALALDAAEALAAGPQVDTVVLVTDDAQLAELVRRLRRQGRFVVMITPQALVAGEPARTADRVVTVEALLAGTAGAEPLAAAEPPRARLAEREPAPPPRARAPAAPLDLETYDWTRLVVLLRDLEAKMPFVGMRWLKNKVLGPHNVGVAGIGEKQLLLNRAVEEGLVETYRVGNRDEAGEPVTACRLLREHAKVVAILAAHPAPPGPAAVAAAPVAEELPSE